MCFRPYGLEFCDLRVAKGQAAEGPGLVGAHTCFAGWLKEGGINMGWNVSPVARESDNCERVLKLMFEYSKSSVLC